MYLGAEGNDNDRFHDLPYTRVEPATDSSNPEYLYTILVRTTVVVQDISLNHSPSGSAGDW